MINNKRYTRLTKSTFAAFNNKGNILYSACAHKNKFFELLYNLSKFFKNIINRSKDQNIITRRSQKLEQLRELSSQLQTNLLDKVKSKEDLENFSADAVIFKSEDAELRLMKNNDEKYCIMLYELNSWFQANEPIPLFHFRFNDDNYNNLKNEIYNLNNKNYFLSNTQEALEINLTQQENSTQKVKPKLTLSIAGSTRKNFQKSKNHDNEPSKKFISNCKSRGLDFLLTEGGKSFDFSKVFSLLEKNKYKELLMKSDLFDCQRLETLFDHKENMTVQDVINCCLMYFPNDNLSRIIYRQQVQAFYELENTINSIVKENSNDKDTLCKLKQYPYFEDLLNKYQEDFEGLKSELCTIKLPDILCDQIPEKFLPKDLALYDGCTKFNMITGSEYDIILTKISNRILNMQDLNKGDTIVIYAYSRACETALTLSKMFPQYNFELHLIDPTNGKLDHGPNNNNNIVQVGENVKELDLFYAKEEFLGNTANKTMIVPGKNTKTEITIFGTTHSDIPKNSKLLEILEQKKPKAPIQFVDCDSETILKDPNTDRAVRTILHQTSLKDTSAMSLT